MTHPLLIFALGALFGVACAILGARFAPPEALLFALAFACALIGGHVFLTLFYENDWTVERRSRR